MRSKISLPVGFLLLLGLFSSVVAGGATAQQSKEKGDAIHVSATLRSGPGHGTAGPPIKKSFP